jgi:hypothetical protein
VEVDTIGFANYPLTTVPSRRAIVKPLAGPSDVKAPVYSGEGHRIAALDTEMFLLTNVSLQPPQPHPVDRLLPQSRLQRMKRLLQRSE